LGAGGGLLQLFETVRELERVRVEELELLLDGDGQVIRVLEGLAGVRDLLVRRQLLRVTHATIVFEAAPAAALQRRANSTFRRPRAGLRCSARLAPPPATRAACSASGQARARRR